MVPLRWAENQKSIKSLYFTCSSPYLWGPIRLPLISVKWNSKDIASVPQQHKFETNHCQIDNNHNLLNNA